MHAVWNTRPETQRVREAGREEERRQKRQDKKEQSETREIEDAEVKETIGLASMT